MAITNHSAALKAWVTLLVTIIPLLVFSQTRNPTLDKIDSLKNLANKEKQDTSKVNLFNTISYELRRVNAEEGLQFAERAIKLSRAIGYKKGEAEGNRFGGINLYRLSQYDSALSYYTRAENLFVELKDDRGLSANYNNIGNIYLARSNLQDALRYYQNALAINEKINNQAELANNLTNIGNVHYNSSQFTEALKSYNRARLLYKHTSNGYNEALSLGNIGSVYSSLGDYLKAVESYHWSMKMYDSLGLPSGKADNLRSIANIMQQIGELDSAYAKLQTALAIWEQLGDKLEQGAVLNGLGTIEIDRSDFEKALGFLNRSKSIYEQIESVEGIAGTLSNIASVYSKRDQLNLAMETQQKALELYEQAGMKYGQSVAHQNIGEILVRQSKYQDALSHFMIALEIADETGDKNMQMTVLKDFSSLYAALGNHKKAYDYQTKAIALEKEIAGAEITKQVNRKMISYEFEVKEKEYQYQQKLTESDLQKQKLIAGQRSLQRNVSIVGILLLVVVAAIISRNYINQKHLNSLLSIERDKSEKLLLNILPKEIADELKDKGESEARLFEDVSVVFTDFKDFSKLAGQLTPQDLVTEINICFKAFDEIISRYGVEKIKTIGDSYMAAGGFNSLSNKSAKNVVRAALDMQEFMVARQAQLIFEKKLFFEMRIGIHTGPVVAGIVGVKKFQYDIWGDTVNTASRMESTGEVGRVNISQNTYELTMDDPEFTFHPRGRIEAKNLGAIEMYFVSKKV
jgi:adenylate cyclase